MVLRVPKVEGYRSASDAWGLQTQSSGTPGLYLILLTRIENASYCVLFSLKKYPDVLLCMIDFFAPVMLASNNSPCVSLFGKSLHVFYLLCVLTSFCSSRTALVLALQKSYSRDTYVAQLIYTLPHQAVCFLRKGALSYRLLCDLWWGHGLEPEWARSKYFVNEIEDYGSRYK